MLESGNYAIESGFAGEAPNAFVRKDPFEPPVKPESATETRARARAAVEAWDADDELKHTATQTLERAGQGAPDGGAADVSGVSRHLLTYSHPLYVSAFRKFTRDPETYVADLTADEVRVWRAAREHQRATLDTSGSVLPSPLDPTIVLTNSGVQDPMRGAARVDTTASKSKRYITSAGSTFSFDAESAEVSDDTFTETEVTINTHKAQGFIEVSLEAARDHGGSFESEVARIIADGKSNLEGLKFIKGAGDGSNEPEGIETIIDGTAAELSPATAETFAVGDLYDVVQSLPARFRNRASWQMELATLNDVRQFASDDGHALLAQLGQGNPQQLLGQPLYLNSSIDSSADINAAATADNFIIFYGDWSAYTVLDRVGMTVNYLPPGVLQGSNGRPTGNVGWYCHWRVGAGLVGATSAIVALNIATTAEETAGGVVLLRRRRYQPGTSSCFAEPPTCPEAPVRCVPGPHLVTCNPAGRHVAGVCRSAGVWGRTYPTHRRGVVLGCLAAVNGT